MAARGSISLASGDAATYAPESGRGNDGGGGNDGFGRRDFLAGAAALSAALGADALLGPAGARAASTRPPLDPVNPDLRFGITSFIWSRDLVRAIRNTAQLGLEGLEPYRQFIPEYAHDPKPLMRMFDESKIALVSCSNGGAGQSMNFIDPAQTPQTIADHVQFAREFLKPFGAKVWKINLGDPGRSRPEGGPTPAQLETMAKTLNEIGRQTADLGIRLAPHPHSWGPLEREPEVRRVMELTDPRYVWLTVDTAHVTLGGMDPVQIISDYFPRVAEIHLKDCLASLRGNKETPPLSDHQKSALYMSLGKGGGVDFPAVFKLLREKHFKGWVALDLDPPRPGDGTGDIDDNLAVNINYLRDVIGLRLPPPQRYRPPLTD